MDSDLLKSRVRALWIYEKSVVEKKNTTKGDKQDSLTEINHRQNWRIYLTLLKWLSRKKLKLKLIGKEILLFHKTWLSKSNQPYEIIITIITFILL